MHVCTFCHINLQKKKRLLGRQNADNITKMSFYIAKCDLNPNGRITCSKRTTVKKVINTIVDEDI